MKPMVALDRGAPHGNQRISPSTPRLRSFNAIATGVAVACAAGLAACGGSDDRCSDAQTLSLSLSWTVNGVANQSIIQGQAGQPLVADPVLYGLPSSCVDRVSYRLVVGALPAGLTLNPRGGRISGTATEAKSFSSTVAIQPDGYFEHDFPFRMAIVP